MLILDWTLLAGSALDWLLTQTGDCVSGGRAASSVHVYCLNCLSDTTDIS